MVDDEQTGDRAAPADEPPRHVGPRFAPSVPPGGFGSAPERERPSEVPPLPGLGGPPTIHVPSAPPPSPSPSPQSAPPAPRPPVAPTAPIDPTPPRTGVAPPPAPRPVAGFAGAGPLPPSPEAEDTTPPLPPHLPPPAPGRPRWIVALGVLVLVLLGAGIVVAIQAARPDPLTPEEAYLQDLEDFGLADQFESDAAALASARRLCRELDEGARPQGYARDLVGVEAFCPEYAELFQGIPTPEEQLAALTAQLDAAELTPLFPAGEEALARAQELCEQLATTDITGNEADAVAVEVFCPDRADGLEVVRTAVVEGSLILNQPGGPDAAPAITVDGARCEGAGIFRDLTVGAAVEVRDETGVLLITSVLEEGRGTAATCTFGFSFEVRDGEEAYQVAVGPLDPVTFTFEDLLTQPLVLELGG